MNKVLVNDQLMDRSAAVIDMEDRGYQFGDGVYEVIRIYGGKLFTGEEHLDRLYASAEKIRLTIPFAKEKLGQLLNQLIDENQVVDGSVYLQFTRGACERNHLFPDTSVTPVLTAYTRSVPRPLQNLEQGVEAITADDIRWLRCDIKSLNLLPNLLAKQEAKEKGSYEAILHRSGTVTEGSSSNAFIVKDGEIVTHPATNLILNGITRQVIGKLCATNHIPFIEREFTVEELKGADEIFVSSTTSEVMPIIKLDGEPVGNGVPGPLTRRLQSLLLAEIQAL